MSKLHNTRFNEISRIESIAIEYNKKEKELAWYEYQSTRLARQKNTTVFEIECNITSQHLIHIDLIELDKEKYFSWTNIAKRY